MENPWWSNVVRGVWVAFALLLVWLGVREAATTDGRLVVENALQHASPAEVESVTVYPFGAGTTRPFQLRTGAGIAPLLAALRQLAPAAVNPKILKREPLATVNVRLTPGGQAAWHLRHREIIFRLSASSQGELAERAVSQIIYRSTLLNQRIRHLRDSLSTR